MVCQGQVDECSSDAVMLCYCGLIDRRVSYQKAVQICASTTRYHAADLEPTNETEPTIWPVRELPRSREKRGVAQLGIAKRRLTMT